MRTHPPELWPLITEAWTCGMRDGVATAARGITEAVKEHELPEALRDFLLSVANSVTLAAYFVPDSPPPSSSP